MSVELTFVFKITIHRLSLQWQIWLYFYDTLPKYSSHSMPKFNQRHSRSISAQKFVTRSAPIRASLTPRGRSDILYSSAIQGRREASYSEHDEVPYLGVRRTHSGETKGCSLGVYRGVSGKREGVLLVSQDAHAFALAFARKALARKALAYECQ